MCRFGPHTDHACSAIRRRVNKTATPVPDVQDRRLFDDGSNDPAASCVASPDHRDTELPLFIRPAGRDSGRETNTVDSFADVVFGTGGVTRS